jgi:hypothetical protein
MDDGTNLFLQLLVSLAIIAVLRWAKSLRSG